MCNNEFSVFFFLLTEGKDELGIFDNFGIGDDSSCIVETNLEGNLSRLIY